MSEQKIPYKIYLSESEMPTTWYNVRADMKKKPAPLLNPTTHQPMTAEELEAVFCRELVKQELDNDNRYIPIPQEIQDFYKMYRPRSPGTGLLSGEETGHPGKDLLQVRGQQHQRQPQAEFRHCPGLLRETAGA